MLHYLLSTCIWDGKIKSVYLWADKDTLLLHLLLKKAGTIFQFLIIVFQGFCWLLVIQHLEKSAYFWNFYTVVFCIVFVLYSWYFYGLFHIKQSFWLNVSLWILFMCVCLIPQIMKYGRALLNPTVLQTQVFTCTLFLGICSLCALWWVRYILISGRMCFGS